MSQKIKTSVEIDGSLKASQIANATTDTDKFLVSDDGTIKYRTGAEMLSDLGIVTGTANHVQHQVKAGVAINKGQAVYVTSADGTNMIVGLASNASEATSSKTMGLLNATVAVNGFADVITEGLLSGLDTSTATIGNPVWLGTNGNLIYGLANKPSAPSHLVFIGIVTRVNANNGEIFVKVQNGFELDELHNVDLITTAPSGNDILAYEGNPVNLWKNKSIAAVLGYTPYNASNPAGYISSYTETDPTVPSYVKSITSTEKSNWNTAFGWGNHASAGYALSGHTHDLGRYSLRAPALIDSVTSSNFRTQLFGSSTSGYNISTARFNATPGLLSGLNNYGTMMAWSGYDTHGFLAIDYAGPAAIIGGGNADNINWTKRLAFLDDTVPNNRTITINGTSYDLSANRSWTVTASETDTLATVTGRGATTSTRTLLNGGWTVPDSITNYIGNFSTNDYSTMTFMSRAWQTVQGANGLAYTFNTHTNGGSGGFGALQIYYGESGYVYSPSSFRAPVFYDSNNTGYYGDFSSISRQYQAISFGDSTRYSAINTTINGAGAGDKLILYGDTFNYDARLLVGADYDILFKSQGNSAGKGSFKFYSGQSCNLAMTIDAYQNTSLNGKLVVGSFPNSTVNNGEAWIGRAADRSAGTMTVQLGGNLDRKFEVVDYGWTTVNFSVNGYGAAEASGSMRAPIFYDSNNTGYYIDPNSMSNISGIVADNWFRTIGQTGLYSQTYGVHFAPTGAAAWQITGSGGNVELQFRSNHNSTVRGYVYADTSNNIGFLNNGGGWALRTDSSNNAYIYGTTLIVNANGAGSSSVDMYDGDEGNRSLHCNSNRIGFLTQAGSWGSYCVDNGDWVTDMISWSGASSRAPIFYDSNNTGYYVDPASSSSLNTANIGVLTFRGVGGDSGVGSIGDMYGIYQQGGSWTYPYPDLCIGYHTGIKIGAYYSYNGTRFYNNSDWATITASVNDGDNNFRGYYDVIAYASDRRLKHKVKPIEDALLKVKSLTGMTYQWNEIGKDHGWDPDTEVREAGVFAQDVQAVLPEAVRLAPFDDEHGVSRSGENFLTVKYDKIVPLLIEAIKEQQTQIEELKELINQLINK